MLYRNFSSQEEIDREYNVSLTVDFAPYAEFCRRESENTRAARSAELGVGFGPTLDETLDIFPAAAANAPVLVFIHGGYWHRPVDSRLFSFAARLLPDDGVTVVVSNYSLCPKVSVDEITRQSRAAVAWLYRNVERFGGDPARIFVSGHSAGGHQVGTLAATDWAGEYGLPTDLIKGAFAISGLFDLRPFRYSWLQPTIQLSHETILRQSPLFHVPAADRQAPPFIAAAGSDESSEFHRQAEAFLNAWVENGHHGRALRLPDKDHFSAIDGFVDRDSVLYRELLALIRGVD